MSLSVVLLLPAPHSPLLDAGATCLAWRQPLNNCSAIEYGGIQVLRHLLWDECVQFPSDSKWTLSFNKGDYGFIVGGLQSEWVRRFLTKTLWIEAGNEVGKELLWSDAAGTTVPLTNHTTQPKFSYFDMNDPYWELPAQCSSCKEIMTIRDAEVVGYGVIVCVLCLNSSKSEDEAWLRDVF